MAWFNFAISVVIGGLFLIVPGLLLAKSLRLDTILSLSAGPFLSVALYGVVSTLLATARVSANWATLFFVSLLPAVAISIIAKMQQCSSQELELDTKLKEHVLNRFALPWWALCILTACIVSLLTTVAVLLSTLSGPDAFVQNYDNAFHLSHVQDYLLTGNYSSFSHGFYPSGWHTLAAMISSCTGVSVPEAALVANVCVIIFAYPLSTFLLLSTLFKNDRERVLIGCCIVTAIAFYPWRILLFGPLCSNLLSFSIMPAVAAVFIRIFQEKASVRQRATYMALFVAGGLSLLFAQPNGVFSTAVFLAPFCVSKFYRFCKTKINNARFMPVLLAVLLALGIIAIWIVLLKMPGLQGVVNYEREVPSTILRSILRALSFSFVLPRAQLVAGVLTIVGAIKLFRTKGLGWIPVSYILLVALFVIAYGWDSCLRKYFVGFWYSDYYRLAASVCVFAIPVLASGVDTFRSALLTLSQRIVSRRINGSNAEAIPVAATATILALALVFNSIPVEAIPHKLRSYGFDAVRYELNLANAKDYGQPLDPDEKEFIHQVKETVPEGSLIVNQPFDGSVFSYALEELNVLFKRYNVSEDPHASAIANCLSEYSDNYTVQEAVKDMGAEYVLQLDYGKDSCGMNPEGTYYRECYDPAYWHGINAIDETTPGFELILSDGDMRLYMIER